MRAPDFWTSQSAAAGIWAALLTPFGALYGLSIRARQALTRPFRPQARVVCVGNLTAGGSGKTPIAIALGRMLAARGKRIVFLTRGYGGRLRGPVQVSPARHSAADVGDEPLLLAAHGITIVAHDRAAGARMADALSAEIILMDDGFQNFHIAKDISILVIDTASMFGNGRLIPAGPLREPVPEGLARADAVVLMGKDAPKLAADVELILHAQLVPTAPEALKGRSVVAFAGIGRPKKFFDMLQRMGAHVVAARPFPDHHSFTPLELSLLKNTAAANHAVLVTTEKDFVRLEPAARRDIIPVPVHAAFAAEESLAPLLDRIAEGGNLPKR